VTSKYPRALVGWRGGAKSDRNRHFAEHARVVEFMTVVKWICVRFALKVVMITQSSLNLLRGTLPSV
jgi:hypothetical protein